MALIKLSIKPLKEARKELEDLLQQGVQQLTLTPPNYPAFPLPPIRPKPLPEGSSRPAVFTYRKPYV